MGRQTKHQTEQERLDKKKEYIQRELNAQIKPATRFLFLCYFFVLVASLAIIFLQGFHAWGFDLGIEPIRWLMVIVVGELIALTWYVFKKIFRN